MTEAPHLKSLTALRFFAAIWVVLFHYWTNLAGAGERPGIIENGALGVELFFVLSGFILCHVYLAAVENGTFRYAGFLWARLARIYPLHLAVMAGLALLAGGAAVAGLAIDPNITSLAALPSNLLLVQAWGFSPVAGWNHPSWSISAEWFAYLTFPVSAWIALKLKNRPWVAVALAVAFMGALYAGFERLAGFPLTEATIAWGALRIVPCFWLGCALYLIYRRRAADRRVWPALGALFFGAGALLAAATQAPDVLIVAGCGGLILCLAELSRAGSTFATQTPFVYLGEISYSVYMICIPWKIVFVNAADKVFGFGEQMPWYLWTVMLIGVVPLSAMSYHLIEKPARRTMKSWAEARERRHRSAIIAA